ncbi:hypothetical protein OD91_0638 [Lutibacter sp. Hel_I_33_5]|uniref:hypothetical protein n=1 Tax=Lutibacter sp. Hel_I_33_5 TaxID=1566289 RepID=UPI0011A10FA0|nr:hypothetical protein [Lutibacter sp. Hel_I_33_5]TVZ55391.1 hypothetical protein OD91_0638 [Lutibacter sp. Hel_I_33_5]
MKNIYKTFLFALLIPAISFGFNIDKKKQEKSKTIKKEYSVNSDATVLIDNKYGNINVTTWNKNKVEIEVKITVKGYDLDRVEEKLESIDVNFNASASLVEAKTIIEGKRNNWSWWGKSKNISYKINYTIKMPESNNVDLDNDYGNIYLDKLSGKGYINCDYGKIEIGELRNDVNKINLDYCSRSTISYMKNGNVNIDYSKLTIDESGDVKLNTDYSTTEFGKVNNINFNADYGNVSIDEVNTVKGNSDYTSMRFGTLSKSLVVDTDYGSIKIKKLKKGFEKIDISSQYAGVTIGLEPGNSFNFIIDLQYAGLSSDGNFDFYKKIVKSSKKYYEGTYGKGKSNSTIRINSQYGGVSIKEKYQ